MSNVTASLVDCKDFQYELGSPVANDQENYSYMVSKTVGMMDGSGAALWPGFVDHAKNEMWVKVPSQYAQFSKDTVTAFLDMAEASGGRVCMCVPMDSGDKAVLMKNFMYMGFRPAPALAGLKKKYLVLCYSTNEN
jgi:hypothetical protein